MSTLSLSAVRQRVSAAIATRMADSGWRHSTATWDEFFAATGDGENRLNKSYAVGVPSSAWIGSGNDRQRTTEGAYSETVVTVRWARTIAALDQITSSDDALDDGQSILNAVMVQAQSEHLHLIYQSCTQRVSQGWIEGEIVIRALHRLALR